MSSPVLGLDREQLVPPHGWSCVPLGSITVEKSERAGPGHELPVLSVTKHDGIVRAEDYFKKAVHGRDTSTYKIVRNGDLAYATIHLDEGSVGVLEMLKAGIVSPMYTVFTPKEASIDPRYLFCALKLPSSLSLYRKLAEGTVNRRASIAYSDLASVLFILPPLGEQKKIVAILSSLDDSIEATRAVIEQLQVVKRAMMAELLTRGLPGRHTRFKATEIGEVPREWQVTTVGMLGDFSGGNGFRPPDWSTTGLPIIRIQNLNGSTDFNYYAREPDASWLVEPGALLFAWAGTRGASFGPCLWPGPRGVLNQHIYRITPRPAVRKAYLYHVLRLLTAAVERRAHGFKESLVHLRKAELTGWPVALPSLSEQDEIVGTLAAFDDRLAAESASLAGLRAAKAAATSVLLAGEVRVRSEEATA